MFKASFLANQVVNDTELNDIGYNFANTVYTTFANGTTYGIEDLNQITANIVGPGVKRGAGENCAVSLSGTTVKISSGSAFFESGVTMTIDDDGISLELEDNSKINYVYLFYNPAVNVAGARCTTDMPSGLEYVLLAEVSGGGEIIQNVERYCKSKIYDAPETPLVLYNTVAATGEEIVQENFFVPGLSKYSMARITFENGYKYKDFSLNRWPSWPAYYLIVEFDKEDMRGFFFINAGKDVQGYPFINTIGSAGNPLKIGLQSGLQSGRRFVSSDICLDVDFENNVLKLTTSVYAKLDSNSVKIELYAGEVQELEEL